MRVRGLTDADIPAVTRFLNEATPENPLDEGELRLWLENPAGDVEFGLVEDDTGELIAYTDLTCPSEQADRAWLDLRIPRRTLSDAAVETALAWAERRALLRGRPRLGTFVSSDSPLRALLAEQGYAPIRFSFHMRIDMDESPPAPVWSDGIVVATAADGDERAIYDAVTDAFADHWEFSRDPFEEWAHFMVGAEDFDPSLWFVAREGSEIVGASLCRPHQPGRPGVGWVRQLGVRPPWRRRGLGLALLLRSFGAFWERGTPTVGLGVDGENTTGAVRLYEKAGMRVEHRFDIYERELA